MNKIFEFLKNYKNKIVLYSIVLLILLSTVYFIGSSDTVALKGLVFLLSVLTYTGVFFGVRFVIFIQNKFSAVIMKMAGQSQESALKSKKILFSVVLIFAVLQSLIRTADFALTLGGFSLIMCSCFYAMFCVFIHLL